MTWLLSLLGIGGLGAAALFFIPGLLPRAIEAAGALLGVVRRNPWQAALIVAVLALGWTWHGKSKAIGQRDAARAQVALWKDANAKATAWAKAEAARKDQLAETAKDNANAALKPSLAAGQAATARYADSHRCLRAADSRGVNADLPRPVPVAGQPSRDGGPDDVAVTRRDLDICTANTLRLDNAVNVWAAEMVARGLAK